MNEVEQQAEAHWKYVESVLEAHGVASEAEVIGFHYKTAFIHGFKHGVESLKINP